MEFERLSMSRVCSNLTVMLSVNLEGENTAAGRRIGG